MSSIANVKAVMGFIRANDRPACKNCPNVEARDCIHPTYWCNKGGFLTSAMAICAEHPANANAQETAQ